ncbi:MAG: RsmB/NOP family class I SAM-dependent RNA methyltransferase [Paracoccaceae bacterium]
MSPPRAPARKSGNRRPVARQADVPGLSARAAAIDMLDSVLGRARMLDEARAQGPAAERAEARGLADLTLRRLGQIDAALESFVHRAPPGRGMQILRLMAAELLFHGTPPHAAVDMGVRLAQARKGTERLSGMINAVGRRLAENGAEIIAEQNAPVLNTPEWLGEALVGDWGMDLALAMTSVHATPAPHDLTLKTQADAPALARETGGIILPTGSLRLPGRPQISALPGYADGAWWVQDAAASLPAKLLPLPEDGRVLDICAAPGGKALQFAAQGAQVTALDLSEARLLRLQDNLTRTGLEAETICADALDWQPELPFHAILLDAPCSATGTIRRHPDLPHRTSGKIDDLVALQRRLIDRAVGWLAPGGVLVYCTCSLLKPEGEAQASHMAEHARLDLLPLTEADGVPSEFITDNGHLRTRPDFWQDKGGLDGFFAARFRRRP